MSALRRILLYSALLKDYAVKLKVLDGVASGTSEVIGNQNARRWIMTVQCDPGVSAGEVWLESGPSFTFTGTWANEGNVTATDGGFSRVVIDNNADFVRVRVQTPIVGGNITVWLEAEGPY